MLVCNNIGDTRDNNNSNKRVFGVISVIVVIIRQINIFLFGCLVLLHTNTNKRTRDADFRQDNSRCGPPQGITKVSWRMEKSN